MPDASVTVASVLIHVHWCSAPKAKCASLEKVVATKKTAIPKAVPKGRSVNKGPVSTILVPTKHATLVHFVGLMKTAVRSACPVVLA